MRARYFVQAGLYRCDKRSTVTINLRSYNIYLRDTYIYVNSRLCALPRHVDRVILFHRISYIQLLLLSTFNFHPPIIVCQYIIICAEMVRSIYY